MKYIEINININTKKTKEEISDFNKKNKTYFFSLQCFYNFCVLIPCFSLFLTIHAALHAKARQK